MRRFAWLVVGACCIAAACANGVLPLNAEDGGVDAAVDGSGCPQYNLMTDPQHCGSCTNACMGGQVCSSGHCSATCAPPTTKCLNTDGGGDAGLCFDLTSDTSHCGQCANACTTADAGGLEAGSSGNPDAGIPTPDGGFPPGPFWSTGTPTCKSSMCGVQCPMGMTACTDGICYDLQNFHDHCGTCGTSCMPDVEWCTSGNCCPTGQAYCGGACTDLLSSASNCGACGHVCGTSTPVCSGGVCTTAITYTDSFTQGATPTTQCSDWTAFTAKLTGTFSSITVKGSLDTTGRTCTGTNANTICQALHNGTAVSALSCGGYTWNVNETCYVTPPATELSVDGTNCTCETTTGYDVRPCIGNLNWGGIGSSCDAPSQTLTVICQ